MKMVNYYNCQGCHKIDGWRGDITAIYEDDLNEGLHISLEKVIGFKLNGYIISWVTFIRLDHGLM